MIFRIVILLAVIGVPAVVNAQTISERSALHSLQKQRWDKAYDQLSKILRKDSVNVTARYLLARYFFSPDNSGFNLDSAYHNVLLALTDFRYATPRTRERMRRIDIDSNTLVLYRGRIDSAAFQRAQASDTEQSYSYFLDHFPYAVQRVEAIYLRDEAAFREAARENTFQAFQQYVDRYPASTRVPEAKARYERLLFEAETGNGKLSQYENFLVRFPTSPYRSVVEKNIFEIRTASGLPKDFETFVERYPESRFSGKARSIYYHLLPEESRDVNRSMLTDSLREVLVQERSYLVPFLSNDRYGFMDQAGEEVIGAEASDIDLSYYCGNITEDVLVLPDKLVSRRGVPLLDGHVTSLEELGNGFLLVETDQCLSVLHKSGFRIDSGCVDGARLVAGKFIALQKDKRLSLWTLTGRKLLEDWDEITGSGNVIQLHRDGIISLARAEDVAAMANREPLQIAGPFDQVKPWADGLLWVRTGEREGLLTASLSSHVPLEDGALQPAFFGAQRSGPDGITLYDQQGRLLQTVPDIRIRMPWIVIRSEGQWKIMREHGAISNAAYDSVAFHGPLLTAFTQDSVDIHFRHDVVKKLPRAVNLLFVAGIDSSSFIIAGQKDRKILYDEKGNALFTVGYDKLQHTGNGTFSAVKKDKRGLITAEGKVILPMIYDAIGTVKDGTISLLKAMKFGLYDLSRGKLIAPEYNKNIISYNADILIACKDKACGLIGWDNKPLSNFEFSEIRFWNDSVALMRKDTRWMLYDIRKREPVMDDITALWFLRDTPFEKLVILKQGVNYGVISSSHGVVIPVNFSDIVNVGSPDVPLYFTEKHVEEASLFVVIYYAHDGRMLRKEVYEQDDYERIYCAGKRP